MNTMIEENESERWYIAVTAHGFPAAVVDQIFELIPRFGLEDFITRVSHERGIRKRGEFYLFLGVTTPHKGHIPAETQNRFQTFLNNLRLWDQGIYLSYDEFKQMASKEIEGRNFRHIRMVKSKNQEPSDPFTMPVDGESLMPIDSDKYEHLLQWLSAVGSGSWELYKSTCQALGLAEDSREAGRIIRRLDVLGHI